MRFFNEFHEFHGCNSQNNPNIWMKISTTLDGNLYDHPYRAFVTPIGSSSPVIGEIFGHHWLRS